MVISATPWALFIFGGGGDVDAFDDFARPFYVTGVAVVVAAIGVLVLGIVLTVRAVRAHRRFRAALAQRSQGPHPYR